MNSIEQSCSEGSIACCAFCTLPIIFRDHLEAMLWSRQWKCFLFRSFSAPSQTHGFHASWTSCFTDLDCHRTRQGSGQLRNDSREDLAEQYLQIWVISHSFTFDGGAQRGQAPFLRPNFCCVQASLILLPTQHLTASAGQGACQQGRVVWAGLAVLGQAAVSLHWAVCDCHCQERWLRGRFSHKLIIGICPNLQILSSHPVT